MRRPSLPPAPVGTAMRRRIRPRMFVLLLTWCALDIGGNVYACFTTLDDCRAFVVTHRGQGNMPLQCWMRYMRGRIGGLDVGRDTKD
jgi:hypothetical protein